MSIRDAAASDAEAIAGLADQLGYTASAAEVRERLGSTTCVVAESGARVVGWMQLERRDLLTTGRIAEVTALVVDAQTRGRGVGIALLEWAEAWAAERGCPQVRIRCNTTREKTHDFYRRRGYRELKTQMVFAKRPRS